MDNVAQGDTVQLLDGKNIKVTRSGKDVTIATADEVSFDKVTVGPVTIDKTTGIDAGDTKITGVAVHSRYRRGQRQLVQRHGE